MTTRSWWAVGLTSVVVVALIGAWRAPEVAVLRWWLRSGHPAMASGDFRPTAPLQWVDDYYLVATLGHDAYAIGEPRYGQCNFSYLIVGAQRALLFDTGPGVRDIAPVVRKLTALPVEALPSHLHFDHVGDLDRFEDVALPNLPALRAQAQGSSLTLRTEQFLGFVEGFQTPTLTVRHWLEPGAEIDLGGRRLTLLYVPGHTPDSVALLDREADRVYTGDFIYPSDIYAFLPGADLSAYAQSARRLLEYAGPATGLYGAHGCDRLPLVEVPRLARGDLEDLARALERAAVPGGHVGEGWYPRTVAVNARMTLLAKYPWMPP